MLVRCRRLRLFKNDILGGPIGAGRNPLQLWIPKQLRMLSSDLKGFHFGTYPHSKPFREGKLERFSFIDTGKRQITANAYVEV